MTVLRQQRRYLQRPHHRTAIASSMKARPVRTRLPHESCRPRTEIGAPVAPSVKPAIRLLPGREPVLYGSTKLMPRPGIAKTRHGYPDELWAPRFRPVHVHERFRISVHRFRMGPQPGKSVGEWDRFDTKATSLAFYLNRFSCLEHFIKYPVQIGSQPRRIEYFGWLHNIRPNYVRVFPNERTYSYPIRFL